MAKVTRGEMMSRIERLERNGDAFQVEFHGMRKDMEAMTSSMVRMETKMDTFSSAKRDEMLNAKGKWGEAAQTIAALVTAAAIVIGGIIWLMRATNAETQIHQQQESQPVYVMPAPSASK